MSQFLRNATGAQYDTGRSLNPTPSSPTLLGGLDAKMGNEDTVPSVLYVTRLELYSREPESRPGIGEHCNSPRLQQGWTIWKMEIKKLLLFIIHFLRSNMDTKCIFSATWIITCQDKSKKTRDFGAYSIPKARCVIRLGTDLCWRRWSTPTGRPAMWNDREINSIMEYTRINQDTVTQFLHRA